MFSNNRTAAWLRSLSVEDRAERFRQAMEGAVLLRKQFRERQAEIASGQR
jgi:hypothetical protein